MFTAPRDKVRAILPAEFNPTGDTAQTADLLFYGIECERAVANASVVPDAGFWSLFARVDLVDENWGKERESLYALDLIATSPVLGNAIDAFGLPHRTATLKKEQTSSGVGPNAYRWTYETQGLTVELEHATSGIPTQTGDSSVFEWYPIPDGFRRVDRESKYVIDRAVEQAGVLRVTGSTSYSDLVSPCCTPWNGQPYDEWSSLWTSNQTVYRK